MDEQDVAVTPAEAVAEPEAFAPAETAESPEPPAADPPPAEDPSALDQYFTRTNIRLAALEAAAHSNHRLDESSIEYIVMLVLARIDARAQKYLS